MEGRPRDAAAVVGHPDPAVLDPQVPHPLGHGQVEVRGVPLGEIAGVRRGVMPQGTRGGRRAGQGRLLADAPVADLAGGAPSLEDAFLRLTGASTEYQARES